MNHTVIDHFSTGEFSWGEWTALKFTAADELRKHIDSLNLIGRKIEYLRMIGLSYMHTREWVEESAFCHYDKILDNEDEVRRLSDYENIDPDLMYDRYAQIDEPFLIGFEDGDNLELISPVEGSFMISMNHIPWGIKAGTNLPNEDADVLFSDCIGQVITGIEIYSISYERVEGKDYSHELIRRESTGDDGIDEVVLRFENGCGLSLMTECHDYCAVCSISKNNEANQLPYRELREGLFNPEDISVDEVTGFESESNGICFGMKGRKWAGSDCLAIVPSGVNTVMYISQDDFWLFKIGFMCLRKEWFDPYWYYQFDYSEWQELLDTVQTILEYQSFDELFDYLVGLKIYTNHSKQNDLLFKLNGDGALFWNNRNWYQTQLEEMRRWTALTLKENDTMKIIGP